jgi:hypothetical protein
VLVAAAVCPHPPLLVPRLAGGFAHDLDVCRAACSTVIEEVLAATPDLLVVAGGGTTTCEHLPSATGTLMPYGLDESLGYGPGPRTLPLSLGIGRWLLAEERLPAVVLQEVAFTETPEKASALGADLANRESRVAVLVMADGSAYPSQTPVGDDGRGVRYDDRWVRALERADSGELLALDPADDGPLWVTGRPALQLLGGALSTSGSPWRGRIEWRGAPYGVGYVVAALESV